MIDEAIEKIIQNPLFLRLKEVVENNGYHEHEDVYSHSIQVKDTAQEEIIGNFITNPEAKELFLKFVNEDVNGIKRSNIMILVALVHDIGKMLSVKEESSTHPLLVTNSSGNTSCPGHEFWGSTIVGQLLADLSLSEEIINYIVAIIRNHDTFSDVYFSGRADWPLDLLINDVKSRAEGFYKEAMFNQLCDCFSAKPYESAKEMVFKIFNSPSFYEKREYVIL